MGVKSILAAALLLATGGAAHAADHSHDDHAMAAPPPACAEVALKCADKATPIFDNKGALWVIWSAQGRVAVQKSNDLARSFSGPVFVNDAVEKLDAGADSRPQLAIDRAGYMIAAYTIAKGPSFTGQVMTARALRGTAFSRPRALTDDTASQRFISFALDPSGDIFAAWIDKRNLVSAQKAGAAYDGAALAFAWAAKGKDFAVTRIAQDNTCECCRIGVAFAGPHKPVVLWRNMFEGGVRDHAVMTFSTGQPGPTYRVAVDDWKIDACPHHGPSLAVGESGTYHATWFTDGSARQGLFYARSKDGGRSFSNPMTIGNNDHQPSRPFVYARGRHVWLIWKEFDGEESVVNLMTSLDDGVTWSKPRALARTADASDHPLLVGRDDAVYLSWLTAQEGYRLIDLKNAP
jgi:hypothetical protein